MQHWAKMGQPSLGIFLGSKLLVIVHQSARLKRVNAVKTGKNEIFRLVISGFKQNSGLIRSISCVYTIKKKKFGYSFHASVLVIDVEHVQTYFVTLHTYIFK